MLTLGNAKDIVAQCAQQKVAYVWGIVIIISIVLLIGVLATRDYQDEQFPRKHFYVPVYMPAVPLLFGIFYTYNATERDLMAWKAEELEYSLSNMPKKEYLQYRVGDDRTNKSFFGTATSAAIISGTNLLGPYIRADR